MPLTFGRFLWEWGSEDVHISWFFKGLGSRHTLSFPFGFSTTTSPLTKLVDFGAGSVISKSTIHFNSFSNLSLRASGAFLTRITTEVTLSFISIWWVFLRDPISPKESQNSDKICSLLTFMAEIRFVRFRYSLVDNPRIGTDFELTTINETSKWSFLCFRVSEHFPTTKIFK